MCSRETFAELVPSLVPGWSSGRRPAQVPMMSSRVRGVGEHGVRVLEHVVDVGRGRDGVLELLLPRGVGRADDPVAGPRDDEQDRLLGLQDQPDLALDALARHDDVDALGREDPQPAVAAGERLGVLRPDAGRVDHGARPDGDLAARLEVLEHGAVHGAGRALGQRDDLCAGGRVRAYDAAVRTSVETRRNRRPTRPSTGRRRRPRRARGRGTSSPCGCATGAGAAASRGVRGDARERVVQRDARADVGTLHTRCSRGTGRERTHEVRRDLLEQEVALRERLLTRWKSSICRYRRPPCTSLLDRLDVPADQSCASTIAVESPRVTASSAIRRR